MTIKLIPRLQTPEVAFQITYGCPEGQPPNWCLAWPSIGRVQILPDDEVREKFDIAAPAPNPAKWTPERKARGSFAFRYVEHNGERHALAPISVVTLLAVQRAADMPDVWASSATICRERSHITDSSADRVSAVLVDLYRAGLLARQQDPLRKARAYVYRLTGAGRAVIDSDGARALAEVNIADQSVDAVAAGLGA